MCLVVSSIEQMSLLLDWCPHITFFNHHWIVFKDFLWKGAHSPLVVIPSLALLAQSECLMPTITQVYSINELSLLGVWCFPRKITYSQVNPPMDLNSLGQKYPIILHIFFYLIKAFMWLLFFCWAYHYQWNHHSQNTQVKCLGSPSKAFFTRVITKCWYFQY